MARDCDGLGIEIELTDGKDAQIRTREARETKAPAIARRTPHLYDPADSLSVAARSNQSGKFGAIPCEVFRVHHLESHLSVSCNAAQLRAREAE